MKNDVDTTRSHFPSFPRVVSSSSWDHPPHTFPPVTVPTKMLNRTEQGYSDLVVTKATFGGGTRLRMLTTTAGGVGKKEGSIGRNTAELNQNQTPDQGQT